LKDTRGRAFAEGLARLNERKTRLMNAGSSMKPRKAQVKDKGLGAKSGDFVVLELKVSLLKPVIRLLRRQFR
jgi:hypothetical protein